jgi:hypothetical protein
MLKKKIIGVALACALALGAWSGSALATPISVGGVTWDPSSPIDLTVQALNFRESSVKNVGDVLTGYGQIGSINGSASFCSSCQLTFTFQYTLSNIYTGGPSPQVVFDMGSIQFYVDGTSSFLVTNPATRGMGTPWLSLVGHTAPNSGYTQPGQLGQLYSTISGPVNAPTSGSNGIGLLDVAGGPAAFWLDTNSVADGIGGFADFNINSEFLTKLAKGCTSTPSPNPNSLCHYPIQGTATLTGTSKVVPEPGPAGLLGIGLAITGLFMRWRRKEAEGRA